MKPGRIHISQLVEAGRMAPLLLAVAILSPALLLAQQEGAAPEPDAEPPQVPASALAAFGRQVPALRPNLGVRIPSFANGTLSSMIEADSLTRLDDQRLFAENLAIELHGAQPKDKVDIDLISATFNMDTQILRSAERSKVRRADFELEGDSLIFDTATSQGRMTGNVRMTIFDPAALLKMNDPEADEGAESTPQVTPPQGTILRDATPRRGTPTAAGSGSAAPAPPPSAQP
jgi:hypothetical protein